MDGLKARLSFDAVAYDYDDEYLTIDTDTHIININNLSRLFGVQYDGNSKLIKFRISNKLSDIQKMQDSIIYINWIDQKGVKGQSIAIDKTISNDICEFAWKVPFDALKNSGVLHFAMSAVITENGSSVINQKWSTQIASVITPDGIYIKSYTPSSEEEDRIAQIYNELSKMINKQIDNLNNLQAQVNQLNEALDDLSYIVNLFDADAIVNDEYYNSDGTTSHTDSTVTTAQRTSQYIPIKVGSTYTWSKNVKLLINTYDNSKTNIERLVTYAGASYTSKIFDSNVRYIRLSTINDTFGKNYFMFVEGDTLPTSYIPYGNRQIIMDKITNLIPTLDDKLGHIKETNETDFNNITESGYYVVTKINYANAPTTNSSGLLVVFTGEANGYQTYQIFSQYKDGRTYIRNQRGTEWGEWSELTNIKEDTGTLGVSKIAWFGDSISALKDLPSKCADLIKCNVVNCAIPGAVMVQNTESNLKYTQSGFYNLMNCLKTNDYTSVDDAYNAFIAEDSQDVYAQHLLNYKNMNWNNVTTVVVFYGTNDYYHGIITLDEYKQKMKEAFTNLMSVQPKVQIYAITPTWRADGNNKNKQNLVLYDYVQATIDVCSELNISCYNLYKNSGINSYTKSTLLISDGLHLTDSGAKVLSEKLSKFLLSS